jgi:hypothetical protein
MNRIVQSACDFICCMLNWDRDDDSVSPQFTVENVTSKDFQLFVQQMSTKSSSLLVYPSPVLMDKYICGTKAKISVSFEPTGGDVGSLRIVVASLPDGFVALKSVPITRSASHSVEIDTASWLSALSRVSFANVCRSHRLDEIVAVQLQVGFRCCHQLPEEGVTTDNKLFNEKMLGTDQSPNDVVGAIRDLIGKSFCACIVAAESGSASVWIGVDNGTRVAIGAPFGTPAHVSIYQRAVMSVIGDLVPSIPLDCVHIHEHPLDFTNVHTFSKPMMYRVKSFHAGLAALRFMQGRAAIGKDPSDNATHYFVIMEEADLLRAKKLADPMEPAHDEWERFVKASEFRDRCRWVKNPGCFVPYVPGQLNVTRRSVIHVSVEVPYVLRGALFIETDAMAYIPAFAPTAAKTNCSSSSSSSCSSSSCGGGFVDTSSMTCETMSWFQIWLRSRAVRSCISVSQLSYALTTCPVTTKVLCYNGDTEKLRLEHAVQVYADSPVVFDASATNASEFADIMKRHSHVVMVGSVQTVCLFLLRSNEQINRNRLLLFTTLSDAAKRDLIFEMLRRVTIADMCLFPVEPQFVPSAVSNITHTLIPVPSVHDIPALVECDLTTLAEDWLLKQHSMKRKAPWELIKSGLVGFTDQSQHLMCLVEATKQKRSQRIQILEVSKQCRCCGATTALQLVAWNIQNGGRPYTARCFFASSECRSPEEKKYITHLANQYRADWLVFFVDDDVGHIDSLLQALCDSHAAFVTVVNVTCSEKDGNHVISPYLQTDSILRIQKVLERVWVNCGDAIQKLIAYIIENSRPDRPKEPISDSHIYVAILTASSGSFQPIRDIVSQCWPDSGSNDQREIATVLCLLSAYTDRPITSCTAFKRADAFKELLKGKFKAMLDTSIPSFISVLHPFIAELCLEHAATTLVEAVGYMKGNLTIDDELWEWYARALLTSRPKGELFSSFVSALLAKGASCGVVFYFLDGKVAANVLEPFDKF